MVKLSYNSAFVYLKKNPPIENIFYFSLILLIVYLIITSIGEKTVENMETSTINPFVSITGNNIYDEFYANMYDILFFSKSKNDYEIDLIIKKTKMTKQSRILDVGSGTGHYVGKLNKAGYYYIRGLDLSQSMINKSRQNYPKSKFDCNDVLKSIIFAQKSFTHILCMYFTIYTIENKLLFFNNCMSWLKPKGYLIVHIVDRYMFDPVLSISSDPYSDKRTTTTRASIKNYKYISDFKLNGDKATFTETFTNVEDNSVRKNIHELFMPSDQSIHSIAESVGFVFVNKTDLKEVGYNNQFIYIFRKPGY